MKKQKRGFTLLEILLVIALIGILASIVLVAINPNNQLAQARNTVRFDDITEVNQALENYFVANRAYPVGITTSYQDICPVGVTTNCVNLSALVPTYMPAIPKDPTGGNYQVALNPTNGQISLKVSTGEIGATIAINPRIVPWAEGGNNVYTITIAGGNYRVHEFTTPGTATLNVTREGYGMEYLVVGGGGGSGYGIGPEALYPVPGGGGQVVSGTTAVSVQSYPVIVGSGGVYTDPGTNGTSSSIFSITANPGLGGVSTAGKGASSGTGLTGGANQGCATGGGGGAGGPGGNALPNCGWDGTGGAGGIGVQSNITGTTRGYGGGGSGVSWNQGSGPVVDGGGSIGLYWSAPLENMTYTAASTVSPTRGGGGGSFQGGGSGTVIVRYPVD
jgi:prepilin-type N-terminal cleavage/methylation domain-containing protein